MRHISVVAGPASVDLASKISEKLGSELVVPEIKVFPDGESKIRIPDVADTCVIVQSTYPPVDTHLVQALMMAKRCRDGGAEVCMVIPYLAYARQDRPFIEGESVTISLIAKLFAAAGAQHVMTVEIHSQLGMSYFAPLGIENVSSTRLLADHARTMNLNKPIAISPDAGGADRVKEFAHHLKCDTFTLKKSRDRATGEVKIEEPDLDCRGRDALLVDDMISSGGSIMAAAKVLRKKGASKVYALCAHALLLDDAPKKIAEAGVDGIVGTNSIPNEYAKVDLSPAIAEVLTSRYRS